jgi:hypothetical protein
VKNKKKSWLLDMVFGAIHDNTVTDTAFVQKVLALNIDIRKLGQNGKPKTQQEMQDRIDEYFQLCQSYGLNPTVEGLALAVDYDRRSLFDIQNGKGRLAFSDIVKKAKDFIANYDAILASANKINSAVYCFRSKNFYGMKDVQQVEVAPTASGDVPNNTDDLVATLPEAPDVIEVDSKKE